jgi:hypothetical protein
VSPNHLDPDQIKPRLPGPTLWQVWWVAPTPMDRRETSIADSPHLSARMAYERIISLRLATTSVSRTPPPRYFQLSIRQLSFPPFESIIMRP